MNKTKVDTARELLLQWMSSGEGKHSYESIRKNCDYLNQAYGLGLEGNALWYLFQPLFRTGVVEFVGKDYYAISPTIAVERNGIFVYNSILPKRTASMTQFTGINRTTSREEVNGMRITQFRAETILRNIPSVKEVVDSFHVTLEDLSNTEYYHYRGKKGLTKRPADGAVRYFCIPDVLYQREVPGRSVNPDAFCIAYSYSRSLNRDFSGYYIKKNRSLQMYSFGLPASIERILFLESMSKNFTPEYTSGSIVFPAINPDVLRELDRILCNTIRHE